MRREYKHVAEDLIEVQADPPFCYCTMNKGEKDLYIDGWIKREGKAVIYRWEIKFCPTCGYPIKKEVRKDDERNADRRS